MLKLVFVSATQIQWSNSGISRLEALPVLGLERE